MRILILISRKLLLFLRILLLKSSTKILVRIMRMFLHRGGVRTIPACNAVSRGFLHIIDFSLCAVIVRSAFAAFTPRGFERFRKDL